MLVYEKACNALHAFNRRSSYQNDVPARREELHGVTLHASLCVREKGMLATCA